MSLSYNYSQYVFVCTILTTILFLCKCVCRKLQVLSVHHLNGFVNYLSTVLDNSKKAVAHQESPSIVTHLQNYSMQMKSWCEDSSSDTMSDPNSTDEESESDQNIPQEQSIKRMQTVGIQTTERNASVTLNMENAQNYQNSRRWNDLPSPSKQQPCDLLTIRRMQQEHLTQLFKQVRYFGEKDLRAPLIICIEANSTNISGYLLNLKQKVCKFYIFDVLLLPWKLKTFPGEWDTTEFKMKNVLFALLLWEQEILSMKKFSFFTNCWAINNQSSDFSKIVIDFLEHFTSCENIVRVNNNTQVSKYHDPDGFAKLIQPARELIYWNLSRFQKYIKGAYGIFDFQGTHLFLDNSQRNGKRDKNKTYRFDYFLSIVNKNAESWCKGCQKCDLKFSKRLDFKTKLFESEPYPLVDNF